jgi:hypothetical protein
MNIKILQKYDESDTVTYKILVDGEEFFLYIFKTIMRTQLYRFVKNKENNGGRMTSLIMINKRIPLDENNPQPAIQRIFNLLLLK